jgi:hypothetical protein
MPSRTDAEVSVRRGGSSILLTGGLALAVGATVAAFLTDDPRYLRLAVVAAAWGIVALALVATRRRAEQRAAAGRAAELRRAYERELDLEAAARREFELELENDLRHETEQAVRSELTALRGDIAALDRVREEIGRVAALAGDLGSLAGLRGDVAALRGHVASLAVLRDDVAALSSLRGDVAALGALRDDLGELGELRADMSRLRAEIVEQLNGEMLVERIIMRTQAYRRPGDAAPSAGATVPAGGLAAAGGTDESWTGEPPRELTSGRPAEPQPTREYETVRSWHGAPSEPLTAAFSFGPPLVDPGEVTPGSRHAAPESPAPRAPVEPMPPSEPAWAPPPPFPSYADVGGRPQPDPESDGHTRLAEILAERGGTPPSGSRRRRRYREDDEPDDVLARVLGRQ